MCVLIRGRPLCRAVRRGQDRSGTGTLIGLLPGIEPTERRQRLDQENELVKFSGEHLHVSEPFRKVRRTPRLSYIDDVALSRNDLAKLDAPTSGWLEG